jgi:flagellin-like hook-associated protein FlgL
MEASDFAMQHASDLAQKAISASLKGLSDTVGPEGRKALAAEVDGLLKEAIDVANTRHTDRYIFSGFTTNIVPYTTTHTDPTDPNKITGIEYKGTNINYPPPQSPLFQPIHRDVGPGETITVNIDGYATFHNLLQTLINVRDALENNQTVAQPTTDANLTGNLNTSTTVPITTSAVILSGQLNGNIATAPIGSTYNTSLLVQDATGANQTIAMTFTKTAANAWDYVASPGTIINDADLNPIPSGHGTITFDAITGDATNTGRILLGTTPITLNMSTVRQPAVVTTPLYASGQDGLASGSYDMTMGVYDSLGELKSFGVHFTRTVNPNVWAWAPSLPNTSGATVVDASGIPLVPPNGTVTFNASGQWVSSTGNLSVPASAGANSPTVVNMDLSGITMLANANSVSLSSQDGLAALRAGSADLNIAMNDVTLATTINGSRMRALEAAQERITTSNTEIKALLSQKEEVNMAEVSALLKNQENIYQTVVTIASRTQSMMNLFESLR